MAHVRTQTVSATAFARFLEVFEGLQERTKQHLSYRRTLRELNELDDRTLDDLGLSRYELPEVARRANR